MNARDVTTIAQKAWDATKAEEDPAFSAVAVEFRGKLETVATAVIETGSAGVQGLERFEKYIAAVYPFDHYVRDLPSPVTPSPEFAAAATERRVKFAEDEAKLLATEITKQEKIRDDAAAKLAKEDEKRDAEIDKLIAKDAPKTDSQGRPVDASGRVLGIDGKPLVPQPEKAPHK